MPPEVGGFAAFRMGYVALGLLGAWLLWRRPRPAAAVALLVALNLLAWAAYVAPLNLPYGFVEHSDRSISIGNAATVAAGNSPFEHIQIRFGNLEPFWSVVAAILAAFRPERVMATYGVLAPLSLVVVALGLYLGLRVDDSEAERWERALMVLAVLGLSSFSMSQHTPVPPLWAANFLLKPNHAIGWGLCGVLIGMRIRRSRPWLLGLGLGLLAWAYFMGWAYLSAGLVVGTLLQRREDREWKDLVLASALGGLVAAPYVAHLARDYNPLGKDATSVQIWHDIVGIPLTLPNWVTLDLGPLLLLGVAGAVLLWQRGRPRDRALLGLLAGAWILWTAYSLATLLRGIAPEPDEIHYFVRVTMALAAGTALAALARHVERSRGLAAGQGYVLTLAACLPLTFPAYWDPPTMDRYYRWGLAPVRRNVAEYGAWVRQNTPGDAVFLAGGEACIWIPALAGRRVLLISASRPPLDYAARKEVERTMLLSRTPDLILAAARRYGVTHVAIDRPMENEYGQEALRGLGKLGVYDPVHVTKAIRILRVRFEVSSPL